MARRASSSSLPSPSPPPLARAQLEVIFGALAVGSAGVAWWQLIGSTRSRSALRSAREPTILQLSRAKPPADATRCSSGSGNNSGGGSGASSRELVAVRGFVQAGGQAGGLGWKPPPPLLPDNGVKQPCAIVERTETILQTEMHLPYGWVTTTPTHTIRSQKSVPFSLADSTHPLASRVDISLVGATQPLPLHTVYNHMHKPSPSLGDAALHVLIGKRLPAGLRTEERALPINHVLTAVGHVRFGSDGRPAIFASPKLPFFLSSDSKAGMLQKLDRQWGVLLGCSLLLSAAAAGIVGFALWRRRRRRDIRFWERVGAWCASLLGRRR
ncbi:unnamed protein product [Closterium sp. Naga37s-1]|nr:unnamed protein product [Closterium sp. Naga37s-1]